MGELRTLQPQTPATLSEGPDPYGVERFYSAASFTGIGQIAEGLTKSGLWKMTRDQAFAILQTGRELGISPTTALSGIHVIQGKACMSGQLMVALVQRAGHKFLVLESTPERAHVKLIRMDGTVHEATFDTEDAKRANLLGKDNWKAYPAAMRLNRAISKCLRYGASDVLGGMVYTPEDFDGTEVDGQITQPVGTAGKLLADLPYVKDDKSKPVVVVDEGPFEWNEGSKTDFYNLLEKMTDAAALAGYPDERIQTFTSHYGAQMNERQDPAVVMDRMYTELGTIEAAAKARAEDPQVPEYGVKLEELDRLFRGAKGAEAATTEVDKWIQREREFGVAEVLPKLEEHLVKVRAAAAKVAAAQKAAAEPAGPLTDPEAMDPKLMDQELFYNWAAIKELLPKADPKLVKPMMVSRACSTLTAEWAGGEVTGGREQTIAIVKGQREWLAANRDA